MNHSDITRIAKEAGNNMTRDDIIKIAQEADEYADKHTPQYVTVPHEWQEIRDERFAALVAAAERESCALLCENQDETDTRYRYDYRRGVLDCADAIRSRGNT